MEASINEDRREISIILTEDEARVLRGELGLALRELDRKDQAQCTYERARTLRSELDEGIKHLNRPTDCCGKVFRPPHPGCACVLAKAKVDAWDKAGQGLTAVQRVPAEHNRRLLEQRVNHAMACAKAYQDQLNRIAVYEGTLEANDQEGIL